MHAHGKAGGVAIGISTSGDSESVVRALRAAREMEMTAIAFSGEGGGHCAAAADILVAVPSRETPRIQEIHELAGHVLCEWVEAELFGDAKS